MPVSREQLMTHWGARRIIYFPAEERLLKYIEVGPESFPPDGAMPVEVPILFTVGIDAPDLRLFSVLSLELGDDAPTILIVIGCVPSNADMLYCLHPASGAVMLLTLDEEQAGYELVNSSFAAFVEFLYRVDELIQSDPGGADRAMRAAALRDELLGIDAAAFDDPESWWNAAFTQLLASR